MPALIQVLALVILAFVPTTEAAACQASPSYNATSAALLALLPKGSCQTYQDHLAGGSLGFCSGVIDYPYFLPVNKEQVDLEQAAQLALVQDNPSAATLLSLLPQQCSIQLKRTACLAAFQPCMLVDPYFVDSTCGQTAICQPCGSMDGQGFYSPDKLNPSYGSVCVGTGVIPDQVNTCVVGPGKVPGMGDMTWQDIQASPQICQMNGLVFDSISGGCKVMLPRTPCKSECDALWSTNTTFDATTLQTTSVCPLVSADFSTLLGGLLHPTSPIVVTDPEATIQLLAAQTVQTQLGRSSLPLLLAFGLAPRCDVAESGVFRFASRFTLEFQNGDSVGALIAAKAMAVSAHPQGKCDCVTPLLAPQEVCGMQTCTELLGNAQCNKQGKSPQTNPSVAFVHQHTSEMPTLCQAITSELNQPDNATLMGLQLGYGLDSRQEAMGAFYVPSAPGLPALASGQQTEPLCQFPSVTQPGQVFTGNDSLSCVFAKVKSAAGLIPGFVQGQCRARFHDLLCNQAFMKLESKSLCLSPIGCASNQYVGSFTHQIPFNFALPRFPARAMCLAMQQDCAPFFSTLTPMQQGMIAVAFNCTGVVQQSCNGNGLATSPWECDSSFNGIDSFPETTQLLANLEALGLPPGLNAVGTSQTSSESILTGLPGVSTCECPSPLVVPNDPTAPTITSGVCCAEVCEGSLYSHDQVDSWQQFQRIMPIITVVGSAFILITWASFRVKRTQPLTFFFAFASFNCGLAFLIPAWSTDDLRTVWCRDNTQAHKQSDLGICLFQSIWIVYWVLCACGFWMVQSIDLYFRIVRNRKGQQLQSLTKYYHLFAWGYPLIVLIVFLATDSMGFEARNSWCFLHAAKPGEEAKKIFLEMVLFYTSILSMWLAGLISMVFVIREIAAVTRRAATHKDNNTLSKRLGMFRTPIFFVFFFIVVWLSIFSWKFESVAMTPQYAEAATNWVTCLLTNYAAGVSDPATSPLANNTLVQKYGKLPGTGCGVSYPIAPAYSSYVFLLCIVGLQGGFIFCIFGLKLENFNLWRERFRLTSKKYDTTGKENESSSRPVPHTGGGGGGGMLSILGLSSSASPKMKKESGKNSAEVEAIGGSAMMMNSIQSGKFLAVQDYPSASPKNPVHSKESEAMAAYMGSSRVDQE